MQQGLARIDTSNPMEPLLFGALISAVDPVATLSIMGSPELNCDPLLYRCVPAELVYQQLESIHPFRNANANALLYLVGGFGGLSHQKPVGDAVWFEVYDRQRHAICLMLLAHHFDVLHLAFRFSSTETRVQTVFCRGVGGLVLLALVCRGTVTVGVHSHGDEHPQPKSSIFSTSTCVPSSGSVCISGSARPTLSVCDGLSSHLISSLSLSLSLTHTHSYHSPFLALSGSLSG